MRPLSLRVRLLTLSAVTLVIAIVVAGFAISAIFSAHVERGLMADLEAQQSRLVALVETDGTLTLSQPMPDPRYQTPGGGMYWQVSESGTTLSIRSRSLWEAVIPDPAANGPTTTTTFEFVDPAGNPARVLWRRLTFVRDDGTSGGTLDVFVAESLAGFAAANAAFRTELAVALGVLGTALLAASTVQTLLGLSPLALLQRGVALVRTGEIKALTGAFPSEVEPLVAEVNELLATQERSIMFARQRAADLAHGLKTSLTLLNAKAEAVRRAGNPDAARAIEDLSASMTETVDHQLRLSRLRHRRGSDLQATLVDPVAQKVIATLRKMPPGDKIEWHGDIAAGTAVVLDRMDLIEMLGAVIENAAKWATGRVSITGEQTSAGATTIRIEDDGAGVDDAAVLALGERGVRIDERKAGSGLGLSIVKEIVGLNRGTLVFGRSPMGGLVVTITLPSGQPG